MKKLAMMLALAALMGCSGKNYGVTEGPFRAKFARSYSFNHVGSVWEGRMFFDGVLPEKPVHVEGYQLNNGAKYYQHHSDWPDIRSRMFLVKNKFSPANYCEAVGVPLDRFNADTQFWNRGRDLQNDQNRFRSAAEDEANGTVEIYFEFSELRQNGQGEWVPGKILAMGGAAESSNS